MVPPQLLTTNERSTEATHDVRQVPGRPPLLVAPRRPQRLPPERKQLPHDLRTGGKTMMTLRERALLRQRRRERDTWRVVALATVGATIALNMRWARR